MLKMVTSLSKNQDSRLETLLHIIIVIIIIIIIKRLTLR